MPISDIVLVALIGAIFGGIISPLVIAGLSRRKTQAESSAIEGGATKSLAEAMKIIADEFIRRIDAKEKDLIHKDQVVDELLSQLRASDKRLADALEDKQRSLAFQMVIEKQASELSTRVGDLEEVCKTLVAENDGLKQQMVEQGRDDAALKEIVSRHSRHIVDLQDDKEALQNELVKRDRARAELHTEIDQLKKRVEELEGENRQLKTRLGEVENGTHPPTLP